MSLTVSSACVVQNTGACVEKLSDPLDGMCCCTDQCGSNLNAFLGQLSASLSRTMDQTILKVWCCGYCYCADNWTGTGTANGVNLIDECAAHFPCDDFNHQETKLLQNNSTNNQRTDDLLNLLAESTSTNTRARAAVGLCAHVCLHVHACSMHACVHRDCG